ncbi:MAG: hypothetical protein KKA19_02250, partial [Candidatus Margulisbacteria bacterium]|nr:hypothetical protein [Candidatus Margulisiibacteriota bacterium]
MVHKKIISSLDPTCILGKTDNLTEQKLQVIKKVSALFDKNIEENRENIFPKGPITDEMISEIIARQNQSLRAGKKDTMDQINAKIFSARMVTPLGEEFSEAGELHEVIRTLETGNIDNN